jgi:hypothetical protein
MRLLNAGPAAPHPPLCTRIKKANPLTSIPKPRQETALIYSCRCWRATNLCFVFSETGYCPMPTEHCRKTHERMTKRSSARPRSERRGFQPRCYLDPLFSNKSWTLIYHAFFKMCNKLSLLLLRLECNIRVVWSP